KLLFARIGKTYSPISGKQVKKDRVADVVDFVKKFPEKEKLLLLSPIHTEGKRKLNDKLKVLLQQGYSRVKFNGYVTRIDEIGPDKKISKKHQKSARLVVDRIVTKDDEDFYNRLADSVQAAFFEGNGELEIE